MVQYENGLFIVAFFLVLFNIAQTLLRVTWYQHCTAAVLPPAL